MFWHSKELPEMDTPQWMRKRLRQGKWHNRLLLAGVFFQCINIFFSFFVIVILEHNLGILTAMSQTLANSVNANDNPVTDDKKSDRAK